MSEETLRRLAYEILPAVRMHLPATKRPLLLFSGGDPFLTASRSQKAFEAWKKGWEGAAPVFLGWQETDPAVLIPTLAASLKDSAGGVMLQDAGLLQVRSTEELPEEGPLTGRIALITGAAQGFGKGLAEHLATDGACVMVADINEQTGRETVRELQEKTGNAAVVFVKADVTDAASVENMVQETVLTFGGLDLFISNAGVLKAGGLEVLDETDFDFVTQVNYKGFYLGTKYASRVMKTQYLYAADRFMDIIQINSKSGLQGSNRNFAYAGSKFGSLGLVQSFALELVQYHIKVNAVCPGNFFDGPLWSDPENGLFVQYLRAGKVAGARSIEDVRRHYESLVPMGRGTTVGDVYKAVCYLIDQEYETGQALPVTGGQVMLK
jgi:sorbitol-6-phosphate 2-dehydrogenase